MRDGIPASKRPLNIKASYQPFRILYFTDAHCQPGLDNNRFSWLGQLARDEEPHAIICGGDIADFESLCSHNRNDSFSGRSKPTFEQDLEHLADALQKFNMHAPVGVPKYITLGNHEERVWTFADANPEMHGMLSTRLLDLFEHYGWEVTMFRRYLTIDGVDFSHAPINGRKQPVGGANVTSNAAKGSVRDIVFGHTHTRGEYVDAKFGDNNRSVRAYVGGCALPPDFIMDYAKASRSAWEYGCSVIEIWNEKIEGISWVSMREMQSCYG